MFANTSNNKVSNATLGAPTESNGSFALFSYDFIPRPVFKIALAPVPAPVPAVLLSIKKPFKWFMQTYIEKIRDQAPSLLIVKAGEEASNRPLKIKNFELYFVNCYIDCFYFC